MRRWKLAVMRVLGHPPLGLVLALAIYVAFVVAWYASSGDDRLQAMRVVAMLAASTAIVAWLVRRRG